MFQGRNLVSCGMLGLLAISALCGCRVPGQYYGSEALQFRAPAAYVLANEPIEEVPPVDYEQDEPTRTAEVERILLVAR